MASTVKDLGLLKNNIRVRFAPSPTGEMHLGNMRTAIVNYLFAKSLGGKFLLRIEDTDLERSKKIYEQSIIDKLKLMNITYDEPIVYQSQNIQYHQEIAHKLLNKQLAYYCQCPSKTDDQYHIICNCEESKYNTGAIRFKIIENTLSFDDFIMGSCTAKGEAIQDFIILRNDGTPTYNLSVVCDDHTMNISHIIRGNDHLSNTFKQIAIYRGMEWDVPITAHLPLIVNSEGKKLSKRDGDITINHYLNEGFLPETLMSFLIRLGWSFKDEEIFTLERLLEIFPQGKFQKSPACYNESKLLFQNKHFLSQRSFDSVKLFILNYWSIDSIINENMAIKGFDLIKSRCNTLKIVAESLKTYIPELFNNHYENYFNDDEKIKIIDLLKQYFNGLHELMDNYMDNYNHLNEFMKNNSIEPKEYQQILRYILTKETIGPHLFQIIQVITLNEVKKRLNNFLQKI